MFVIIISIDREKYCFKVHCQSTALIKTKGIKNYNYLFSLLLYKKYVSTPEEIAFHCSG